MAKRKMHSQREGLPKLWICMLVQFASGLTLIATEFQFTIVFFGGSHKMIDRTNDLS